MEEYHDLYQEIRSWHHFPITRRLSKGVVEYVDRNIIIYGVPINKVPNQRHFDIIIKTIISMRAAIIADASYINFDKIRSLFTQHNDIRWLPCDLFDSIITPMVLRANLHAIKLLSLENIPLASIVRDDIGFASAMVRQLRKDVLSLPCTISSLHKAKGEQIIFINRNCHNYITIRCKFATMRESMDIAGRVRSVESISDIEKFKQLILDIVTPKSQIPPIIEYNDI